MIASLRVWLVGAMAWLLDVIAYAEAHATPRFPFKHLLTRLVARYGAGLIADLRFLAIDLRHALFLSAFARLNLQSVNHRPALRRPASTPAGFRRASNDPGLRRLMRPALTGLHVGTLRQRLARLQRILDNPEPWIARVLRHLKRILRAERPCILILIACAAAPLATAPAAPVAAADTS